jgi:hypothetical protein
MEQRDQDITSSVFRQLNSYLEELCRAVGIEPKQPDPEAQRNSQIGTQITALVEYVKGERAIGSTELELSIEKLQRLLYTGPLGTYRLPPDFHKTPLGALINEARLRFIWIGDALNPTQVAKELGVTRQTIYDWMDQGKLQPVWVNDHPLIPPPQAMLLRNRLAKSKR